MSAVSNESYLFPQNSFVSKAFASIPVLGWYENFHSQNLLQVRVEEARKKIDANAFSFKPLQDKKSFYLNSLIKIIEVKNHYKLAGIISDIILIALITHYFAHTSLALNLIGVGVSLHIFKNIWDRYHNRSNINDLQMGHYYANVKY